MTGLAYSAEYQRTQDPIRVPAAFALAFFVHFLPLAYLIMPAPPEPEPEDLQTATVDITDFTTAPADNPPSKELQPDKVAAVSLPVLTPETKVAPAMPAPTPPPPAALEQPKPPEAAQPIPAPKAPEAPQQEVKTDKLAIVPFKKENMAAFDESNKTTDKAPDHSYASDRNSTAADNGPKDLLRGDPYMKDGESNIVRDREKRGEGNLPPIASSENSGSVKIEGSPDAGKGLENAQPDRDRPLVVAVPLDKPTSVSRPLPPLIPTAHKPEEIAAPEENNHVSPASKLKPAGFEAGSLGSLPTGAQAMKGPDKAAAAPKRKPDAVTPAPSKIVAPEQPAALVAQKSSAKVDDPDWRTKFDAELESATVKTSGAGGEKGDKPGIQARPGQKGHEGDGALRPGNENATSNVVTFNISSSAEEVDQPRFAKRLDPIATYFKPIKRRTDTKWKAMLAGPGLRARVAVGVVTIHVVVHKSGKLLEATVESRTDGLPDEYAYMAKEAVERACDPAADPFSGELAKSDKVECYFSFFY